MVHAQAGTLQVVGRFPACTLAWVAADAGPDRLAGVAMIGGLPVSGQRAYADPFEFVDGAMPFPGWGPFDGPDAADLDQGRRRAIESAAIPVPGDVAKGTVQLRSERRFEVPEHAKARRVTCADSASGPGPMFNRPVELARLLASVADG